MTDDLKRLTSLLQAHDPASHVRADPVAMSAALADTLSSTTRTPQTAKRRWSRRHVLTLIPITAVLVGATVVLPIIMQPSDEGSLILGPAKALAFTRNGDHIDVRIVDPDADPRRYREDFAAHGLDVRLKMEPSSPSLVGTVISISSPGTVTGDGRHGFEIKHQHGSDRIKTIEGSNCGNVWCKSGVSIPLNLRNPIEIIFGRAARPGERYTFAGDPTAPGEILEGVDLTNQTVAEVKRILRQRHATIESYHEAPPEPFPHDLAGWDYTEHVLQPVSVPDTWYVHEAFGGHYRNSVRLVVASWPTSHPR